MFNTTANTRIIKVTILLLYRIEPSYKLTILNGQYDLSIILCLDFINKVSSLNSINACTQRD